MRVHNLLLCLLLGSCASNISQKIDDPVALTAKCEVSALSAYPVVFQDIVLSPEKTIDNPISCKLSDIIRCETGNQKTIPAQTTKADININLRKQYIATCLKLK